MATLGNSRRNGIGAFLHTILTNVWNIHFSILAQLPMTREFFEWFLRVAQSGDEDSDEQDMGHEVQNIPLVLTQPSNDGVDLHYDNLQGDMPQAGLATVDGVNMALGHVIPQSTEQPTDHESSIAPQPFAHFQAPIPPIHIATLESPQGSSWTSGDFQNPNANFGAGAAVVPNVPVSVAPVPYTIEIDLQDVARRMGCILVPFS